MADVLYALLGLVAALLGIAFLIFIHEIGHFLAAKRVGVGVKEFAIGFGKKLWGFKKGETMYNLRAIPLGGFVKIQGYDSELEPGDDPKKSFMSKPKLKRLQVLAGGVVFNFLLAILVFTVVNIHGVKKIAPVITPAGPAAQVLVAGDKIRAVNAVEVLDWEDVKEELKKADGSPVTLTIIRGGLEKDVEIIPVKVEAEDEFGVKVEKWVIGIQPVGETFTDSMKPAEAFFEGVNFSGKIFKLTGVGVAKLCTNKAKPSKILGGPVFIISIMALLVKEGFFTYLYFLGLVSLLLGIMNALPIPALDGGHMMFLGIEAIRGKPLNKKILERIQDIFFITLLCLLAYVTYIDIARLFEWFI